MYATESDINQIIGRLPIASGMNVQSFLDDASGKMHLSMLGIYEVPITVKSETSSVTSGIVSDILRTIQKELAGGSLLLSLDTTAENDNIHAYGEYLVAEAQKKLDDIRAQALILPGVEIDEDLSDNTGRPGKALSSSPDSSSYFGRDYDEIGVNRIDGGLL